MNNFFKHTLETHTPQSMSKITSYIREDIKKSNIENGIVVVYCPHTTAGITINENADPDVVMDLKKFIQLMIINIDILKAIHIHTLKVLQLEYLSN